jgi:hypothetical protein
MTKVDTGTGANETLTSTSGTWVTGARARLSASPSRLSCRPGRGCPNLYTRSLKPGKTKHGQILKITLSYRD